MQNEDGLGQGGNVDDAKITRVVADADLSNPGPTVFIGFQSSGQASLNPIDRNLASRRAPCGKPRIASNASPRKATGFIV